jgi:hypothetical protein
VAHRGRAGCEQRLEVSQAFDDAIEKREAEFTFVEQWPLAEFKTPLLWSTPQQESFSLVGFSPKRLDYPQWKSDSRSRKTRLPHISQSVISRY